MPIPLNKFQLVFISFKQSIFVCLNTGNIGRFKHYSHLLHIKWILVAIQISILESSFSPLRFLLNGLNRIDLCQQSGVVHMVRFQKAKEIGYVNQKTGSVKVPIPSN